MQLHSWMPLIQFQVPCGGKVRMETFPKLQSKVITLRGLDWRRSAGDVILSSAGWVAVTAGSSHSVTLHAHTPGGEGIALRVPSLLPEAVNERGKRSKKNDRTAYLGHM